MGRITELVFGLVMLALAVAVWVYAQSFPSLRDGHPGPALFPQVVSIFLGLSGLMLSILALRSRPRDVPTEAPRMELGGAARLLIVVVLASLYPVAQEWLGFIPTVGLLSFGVAFLLQAPLLKALITSIIGTIVIYWIFTSLLGVPL